MLIVGLGNYGEQYDKTVHNIGFMTVDKVSERLQLKLKNKGCDSMFGESFVKGEKLVIAQPLTYMNLSGVACKQLLGKNKWTSADMLVIYDDIDLPLGAVRVRKDGSGGTHNGMKNIIAELGTQNILRIRVGACTELTKKIPLADYVLSRLGGEQKETLSAVLDKVADAIVDYINDRNIDNLMRECNGVIIK